MLRNLWNLITLLLLEIGSDPHSHTHILKYSLKPFAMVGTINPYVLPVWCSPINHWHIVNYFHFYCVVENTPDTSHNWRKQLCCKTQTVIVLMLMLFSELKCPMTSVLCKFRHQFIFITNSWLVTSASLLSWPDESIEFSWTAY